MSEITVGIHWFAISIWVSHQKIAKLWGDWFEPYLGKLEDKGHGGRGFKGMWLGLSQSKVYYLPVRNVDVDEDYIHIEFPGKACEAIPPVILSEFVRHLALTYRFNVTRLDVAFDQLGCGWLP